MKTIRNIKALFLALILIAALALTGCGAEKISTIQIAVPNDTTNEARALLLLEENGIIKLAEGAGIVATKNDIVENPYNVEIIEAEAAQLPNILQDVDYAVINSNYAINAGLNPVADSLTIEGSSSVYSNILDGGQVAEEGLVAAVFAAPKSAAAKRLVFPNAADEEVSNPVEEGRVRLVFRDSKTTGIPLVARLAVEHGILCNVISATTQRLSEEVYGSLYLGIPKEKLEQAMAFFATIPNVQAQEVSEHV